MKNSWPVSPSLIEEEEEERDLINDLKRYGRLVAGVALPDNPAIRIHIHMLIYR